MSRAKKEVKVVAKKTPAAAVASTPLPAVQTTPQALPAKAKKVGGLDVVKRARKPAAKRSSASVVVGPAIIETAPVVSNKDASNGGGVALGKVQAPTEVMEVETKSAKKIKSGSKFVDFGAPVELGAHVFRMTVRPSQNEATLVEDYGSLIDGIFDDDPEQPRANLPLAVWKQVAEFVKRDFNERLRTQGQKVGAWKAAGEVLIDRLLGRELALLWWSLEGLTADNRGAIGAALKSWQSLRPEERWWLASMVANGAGGPGDGDKGWRRAVRTALVEGSFAPGEIVGASVDLPAPLPRVAPDASLPEMQQLRQLLGDMQSYLLARRSADNDLTSLVERMQGLLGGNGSGTKGKSPAGGVEVKNSWGEAGIGGTPVSTTTKAADTKPGKKKSAASKEQAKPADGVEAVLATAEPSKKRVSRKASTKKL